MKNIAKISSVLAVAAFALAFAVPTADAATCSAAQFAAYTGTMDTASIDAYCASANMSAPVSTTGASLLGSYPGGLYKFGSNGSAVMSIQSCLATAGYAPGPVDGAFGSKTTAAVKAAQASAGVAVDGVVGGQTWPVLGAMCMTGSTPVVNPPVVANPAPVVSIVTGNLASIEDYDIKKEEDVMEGGTEIVIEAEFTPEDSYVVMEYADFYVLDNGDEPWDFFTEGTLMFDGEEVASGATARDLDDKDSWAEVTISGTDYFRLRFDVRGSYFAGTTNVDPATQTIATAEEEAMFALELTADEDLSSYPTFDISFEGIGTDSAVFTQYVGDITDAVSFDVEALDPFDLSEDEHDDNPEDYTVSLQDSKDGETILMMEVEATDQDGVIEDIDVTVEFTFDAALTVALETEDLVSEIDLYLDGSKVDSDDANVSAAIGDTSATVVFSFDAGDLDVEEDEEFDFELKADFEELDDSSEFIGTEVQVTSVDFDGEDSVGDDFTTVTLSPTAPVVTASAGALVLENSSVDGYNEYGSETAAEVTFEIEIENDGDNDIVIDAVLFDVEDPADYTTEAEDETSVDMEASTAAYQISIEDSSNDDVVLGTYAVNDGDTETLTITVDVSSANGGDGRYELELVGIEWSDATAGTSGTLDLSLAADDALLAVS